MLEYVLSAAQCIVGCFERIVKFINKNAYIQCAISSNNFCTCCKDAFFIILQNAFLFAIANTIGEVFIYVGKFFIATLTTVAAWALIDRYHKDEIMLIYGPLLIVAIIGYAIGTMFMTVWGMAADAILQCYCIDE